MRFIIITLLIAAVCSLAQVPQNINYQGKLTDPSGVAIDGTANILFRIYDVETGGTMLWSEAHPAITLSNGLFDVILGEVSAMSLPFDNEYWIEIEIDGETLAPREKLASVAYAHRAIYADTAGYERTPTPPAELLANNFDSNMEGVMFNDGDIHGNAQPIYWDGSNLRFDQPPLTESDISDSEIKAHLETNPESLTESDWKSLERKGIDCEALRTQIAKTSAISDEEIFYDAFGTQIPPEWLNELRAEGVPMFNYDEMMTRRKEALIANVRANKQAKEIAGFNDDPEKMMPVENRPSVVSKHINKLTGDVVFARHDGTYYDMQGNVISEDAVVIFESTITTNENPQKDLGESTTGNRSKTE